MDSSGRSTGLRQALRTAIAAAAIVASAGAMMASPPPSGPFVYVGNAESSDIDVLQLDRQSGELTTIERVAIPGVTTPGTSTPMAVSPDRRFLYVGTRGEPRMVACFSINPTSGRLEHVGNGRLADSMAFLSIDRTGRFLFGASYPGHKISVSPIGPRGIVQPTQQILPDHANAHAVRADAANRYVLVSTLGNDLMNVFTFDAATGALQPNTPPAVHLNAGSGPRHFVFHPNGTRVYVLGELDGSVHVFDYDSRQGRLTAKASMSALPTGFAGKPAAADLHITPDGKFLYASERMSSTLTGFRVSPSDGSLALIESLPTETTPRGFNIDSSGRYLLVVGQSSHRMSSYRIAPDTGRLTKLKDYAVGRNPNWIELVDLP